MQDSYVNAVNHRYFIINKPYDMLSQFISEREADLLGKLAFNFPAGVHAVGRLDKQSEGLLIITNNKKVTRLLFQGETLHKRTYLVKVKNAVSNESLQMLREGISIRIKGGAYYRTRPCTVHIVQPPHNLFPQINPLPGHAAHTWLRFTITEGKFHQIRKMVKAIHHRCQRLIRTAIEDLEMDDLQPGEVREIAEPDFFALLKISYGQQPADR